MRALAVSPSSVLESEWAYSRSSSSLCSEGQDRRSQSARGGARCRGRGSIAPEIGDGDLESLRHVAMWKAVEKD